MLLASLLIAAAILAYRVIRLNNEIKSLTTIYDKVVSASRDDKKTINGAIVETVVFPPSETKTKTVASLLNLTKQYEVKSDQGEYQMTSFLNSRLVHYRIRMPVHGTYQAIRKFVAQALHDNSSLALDRISFSKSKVEEPTVDAELVMTLILSDNS